MNFFRFYLRGSLMTSKPEKRVAMALASDRKNFLRSTDATNIREYSWDWNLQPKIDRMIAEVARRRPTNVHWRISSLNWIQLLRGSPDPF
jgi:hypothetical protein